MKKYDPNWNKINTLLSYLRSANVVSLVKNYYSAYQNDAPSNLLEKQIEEVQSILDNAKK